MKKRVLSLILILVMVMSMVGCGNKNEDASLTDILEKTETMNTGAGSTEFSFKANLDNAGDSVNEMIAPEVKQVFETFKSGVFIKLDYIMESMDKMQMACYYKLKEGEAYTKLTEIIICPKTVYIDVKSLKEAVEVISPVFKIYTSVIPVDQDYIKITEDDLKQIAEMTNQINPTDITDILGDFSEYEEQKQFASIIAKTIGQYFDQAVKEVEPSVITGDNERVTIKVTDKNVTDTVKALEETDITKYVDEFIEKAGKLEQLKKVVEDVKKDKETFIKEYKDGLKQVENELKKMEEQKLEFALEYTIEVTGKEGDRKKVVSFSATAKDPKNSIELVCKSNLDEKTDKKVTEPASSMSAMEFILKVGAALGNN